MLLGGLVAYVLVRTRFGVRRVLEILAWLPWMMPGMVLGVGFLWAYALLPGPIQLYGTLWALLVAYITLGTPLAVRTMSGAFAQLAYDLEECSRVHGAAWWTTFRRILLALAWPSFAVGFILIFFVILRELSASILLYSVGNEVLAVVVMRLWTEGKAGQVSVIALVMLATGAAYALPPYIPNGATNGTPPGSDPSIGPDPFNSCNNGGPSTPQALGNGGTSTGSGAAGDGSTGYHRYASDQAIGGLDACLGLGGILPFAGCAATTEAAAVVAGAGVIVGGGVPGLPGTVSAGAGIITSATGNVVSGGACGGILGTGTDGEFEYGSDLAFLNVRTGAGASGGDGLGSCYGGAANCGGVTTGCLGDNFVAASAHHFGDSTIFVEDVVSGGNIGFTVASDWSRPANTSSSGVDLNTQAGRQHCGDGVIEPCLTPAPHRGIVNDARVGDTPTLGADLAYLSNPANTPTSSDKLAAWDEVRVGCNPDDYAVNVLPSPCGCPVNVYNFGAALSGFGAAGYTGGAAGYLIVLIDNPVSDGVTYDLSQTVPVGTVNVPSGGPTAGWVWTGP